MGEKGYGGGIDLKSETDIGKGQSISKCPFGVIVWTKIPTKYFPRFLP